MLMLYGFICKLFMQISLYILFLCPKHYLASVYLEIYRVLNSQRESIKSIFRRSEAVNIMRDHERSATFDIMRDQEG